MSGLTTELGPSRVVALLFPGFSSWNRARKASVVASLASRIEVRSVLLVGIGEGGVEALPVEHGALSVAPRPMIVACDPHHGTAVHWPYVCCDGRALPFRENAFDLVISNAVIEHVGDEDAQQQFASEHDRVGKNWILTTPNRWFPVESHTKTVFLHWSRRWRARQRLFTRLLSRRDLRRLLPSQSDVKGTWWSPTFLAVSNTSTGGS
jgi:hypothetical protein